MRQGTRRRRLFPVKGVAWIALLIAWAATTHADDDGDEIPFAEAEIFFELNDTDGDLGIHASIDGEPWTRLTIEDPNDREILKIRVRRRLRRQGLTQLSFESAEPPFDELAPEEFFRRFPEGDYEIEGETLEGGELESTAHLSHVMPAPPDNVLVSGMPAAEDCDAMDLPVVSVLMPIEIRWDLVTGSHPEIGNPGPIDVVQYQLFIAGSPSTSHPPRTLSRSHPKSSSPMPMSSSSRSSSPKRAATIRPSKAASSLVAE